MATLEAIWNTFNAHEPVSKEYIQFKAVLTLFISADPQHEDEDFLTALSEGLTVDTLYDMSKMCGPTIPFRILRDYLMLKILEYAAYPQNRQIQFGRVSSFFESEEDIQLAFHSMQSLRTSTTTNSETGGQKRKRHASDE